MSKDKPPTNPLFLGNNFNFPTNTLFMPVQEQSSAILSPENDVDESAFIEQPTSSAGNNGTFGTSQGAFNALFGASSSQDPFAGVGLTSSSSTQPASNTVGNSGHQEPMLFVPQSTAPGSPVSISQSASFPVIPQPVVSNAAADGMAPPQPSQSNPVNVSNPYALSGGGRSSRPQYAANPQMFPTAPASGMPPIFSPSQVSMSQPTPPAPVMPPQSLSAPALSSSNQSIMPPSFDQLASTPPPPPPTTANVQQNMYQPITPHWFYCKVLADNKSLWCPFSFVDSSNLENAAISDSSIDIVSTDGGRYDVCMSTKSRNSVYWDEAPAQIRRCTWFHKADDQSRFLPYDEVLAERLEAEYRDIVTSGMWHKRIELGNGEVVMVHNPQLIVHFEPYKVNDELGVFPETQMRSKVVRRGISTTDLSRDVPENESGVPDHVVFFCHGIGPVCDLRARSVVECVDDFRAIHLSLLQSHFKQNVDRKSAKRIEFLPIHWHRALHGDATGVDRNIRNLTLPSIARLRSFTNETLLDILFYSSPVYCQTIAETVGNEINSLHQLFMSRNPNFKGNTSLAGHSLGSLILFDLLCNQNVDGSTSVLPPEKPLATPAPPTINVTPQAATPVSAKPAAADTVSVASEGSNSLSTAASASKLFGSTHSLSRSEDSKRVITLEQTLEQLHLSTLLPKFEQECVDFDALIMCDDSDLKDIGVPMGPRKKLMSFIRDHQERERKRQEEMEKLAAQMQEAELLEQQQVLSEAATTPIPSGIVPSNPALPDNNGISSSSLPSNRTPNFLDFATNVHVDFQQFDSGTGQPAVHYPQLKMQPQALFALGSPIGMFLTVRGIDELGEEFSLPTCPGFFNIFHPFDPVAYRVEPLIDSEFNGKPIQVPHYKGRKRLHLELRDSLGRMGHELKEGIMRSVRLAIGSMQKFAQNHWNQQQENAEQEVEQEVKQMTEQLLNGDKQDDDTASVLSDVPDTFCGQLNSGKRIDYVLQERPLESFNDYLFAFQSHCCYWNNEDTVLLMMKEIYNQMGVLTDKQLQSRGVRPAMGGPPPLAPPPAAAATFPPSNSPPPMTNISLS